jgi:Mn-dependent DtxR family transcriptional regulator
MAHNRSEGDTFSLTQQFLGEMMGVRRATVTEVMLSMRRRRLVDYSRGRIRILDREGLEGASCECYETLHLGLEELLRPRSV